MNLITIIKPFIPQIKEKAAPAIEQALGQALDGIADKEGHQKAIMIMRKKDNRIFAMRVRISKDDKLLELVDQYPIESLTNNLLESLTKIQ